MRATLLTGISAALVLGFAGRWIIHLWAGNPAVPTVGLLWGMCFWAVLFSMTVNQAALLAATQRLQLQAVCSTLTAILNLVLSIALVQRIGVIGVLSGTIISYLLFVVLPQSWEVRRILRGRYIKARLEQIETVPEVSIYGI
jgi:O-antigen/teichoic acid export membrane protein